MMLSTATRIAAAAFVAASAAGQAVETDAPAAGQPAGAAELRTATVVLQDGQVITGELVSESDESVVLLISGVRTTINTDRIRETYIQPPIEERYRRIRATISDDDPEQLVQIAEWLLARARPDLAVPDLEAALRADPFHERARELIVVAKETRRLLDAQQDGQGQDEADDTSTRPAAGGDAEQGDGDGSRPPTAAELASGFPLITDDEVNVIRVYEVDLDRPPPMSVPRETLDRVFADFAGQPGVPVTEAGREALRQAPAAEQLALLFSLRAREHYASVEVRSEPEALRRFRDDVYATWLARGCASFRCHGGLEAGRLRLPRARRTDPKVYLTAMLILEAYRTDDGLPIIDFQQPADSILLQAGLPRHVAAWPHPEVPGWRSVFRSDIGGRFREGVEWIDAMYTPRPDYPVDYTPPTAMDRAEEPERPAR